MRLLVAALVAGCQPRAWPVPEVCPAGPPPAGEVVVARISCEEMDIAGAEARSADLYLANQRFSALLRHPQDALTLAGVGGGTIIDAAPWNLRDRLHEVAPLVGGGWLDVQDWSLEPDAVRLAGSVVSLPDRPADTPGVWREVRWRVRPDSPWLELEGADGLWLHVAGSSEVLDGQVIASGDVVYGHDGVVDEDLGGALRIVGASGLLIAPSDEAWGAIAAEPVRVSGRALDATSIVAWREDVAVARFPVRDQVFDVLVDARVTHLEARAAGRAPSGRVPRGEGLDLRLGGSGSVILSPAWTGRPRPFKVAWSSDDGRKGRSVFRADGGELAIGEGAYDLTLSAGPAWRERTVRVELRDGDVRPLGVALEPLFDPGQRALAALSWPGDRARTWRGSDTSAAWLASGAGYDFAVFTPEDETSAVDPNPIPDLIARPGARLPDRQGAWAIVSWPWSDNDKNNAHGVVDIAGYAPEEALALAWGGPVRDRHLVVDLPWLDAVGAPSLVDPAPGMVALTHPGLDGTGWAPWFAWLDAGELLVPVGPYTWVDVADPDVLGPADIEQALVRGAVCAGTGPLLTLSVNGAGPGDLLGSVGRPADRIAHVTLLGGEDLDRIALVGEGGVTISAWSGPGPHRVPVDRERWVAAMAWSTTTDAWAATGALWVNPP